MHHNPPPSSSPRLARLARLAGHFGFLALGIMSLLLANERVLYIDSAAQLFEMLQRGSFVVFDHRYTMIVTQLLPFLLIKSGMPLRVIVAGYSIAAPLLGWAVYTFIVYGLKDVRLGLLLLLPLLCIRHTFFHAISETFSLAIYATLLLALMTHRPQRGSRYAVPYAAGVLLSTLACIFIHPIGMFYVLFLVGHHWIGQHLRPTSTLVLTTVALVAGAAVKMSLGSDHDAEYMLTLGQAVHYLTTPSEMKIVHQFASRMGDFYFYPIALYAVALVFHCRRRQWLSLAYGIAFNTAFLLMTLVVYHDGGNALNVERSFLPLMFFAGVPFLCEVVPACSRRWQSILLGLLTMTLVLALVKIVDTSRHYSQRLDKLEEIADEGRRLGHRKMVTDRHRAEGVFDIDSWATGFESVLLSSLKGPDQSVSIYIEEDAVDASNPDYREANAMLGVPWWRLWYYNALPQRWIMLPEEPYCLLDFADSKPLLSDMESD